MLSVAEVQSPPEAPPPANGGNVPHAVQQAAAAVAATILPDNVKRDLARLEQVRKLGHEVAAQQVVLAEAETEVAEATSVRQAAMDAKNKAQSRLDDLLNDLAQLADGKFIDKLPFADPSSGEAQAETKPDPDAWKSVPLADIDEFPSALLTLLADGKVKRGPGQGEVAGIRTLGQLAAFTAGDRKLTDIGGLGEAKATAVGDIVDRYWVAHPVGEVGKPAATEDAAAPRLVWQGADEADWYAENTAGVVDADGAPCCFTIDQDGKVFKVDGSHSRLMPAEYPDPFETVELAQAWCEARDAELVATNPQNHLGTTTVVNIEALGLPTSAAEAACFANLLPWLSRGDRVKIDRTITIGGMEFLVTPNDYDKDDVYAFRRIQLDSENVAVLEEGDANPYAGKKIVRGDAKDWVIGGTSDTMFVRDPGTKAESAPEADTVPVAAAMGKKGGKKKAKRRK